MRQAIKSLVMVLIVIFMVSCSTQLKPAMKSNAANQAVVQKTPSAVQMLRSVVRVGSASGVVIAKNSDRTVILTTWHVVKRFIGPPQFNGKKVTFPRSKHIPVRVMIMDDLGNVVMKQSYKGEVNTSSLNNDMALVVVKQKLPSVVADIGRRLPRFGDRVWAIGHPYKRYFYTLVTGIVSHPQQQLRFRTGILSWRVKTYMQISTGIVGGNSGGPVFDRMGRVIGVAVGSVTAAPHLGFTTTLPQIKAMLAKASILKKPVPKPKLKPQPKRQVKTNGKESK